MKQTLEKIVSKVKEVGKESWKAVKDNAKVLALGTALAIGGAAYGGEIKIYNSDGVSGNGVGGSIMYNQNIQDANELYDIYDAPWSGAPQNPEPNWLKIYSAPYTEELQYDCRPINSTTTLNTKLSVVNGPVTCQNKIKFQITDNTNLEWQNIIAERYGLDDINDSNNIKNKWDVKYINGQWIQLAPLVNQSGIYDQIPIKKFNHVDLNRDRKVNFLDFAVYANEYGKDNTSNPNRFGSYVGADVNDLGAYADIDRNGSVDVNDLNYISYEWLWNADDPNT